MTFTFHHNGRKIIFTNIPPIQRHTEVKVQSIFTSFAVLAPTLWNTLLKQGEPSNNSLLQLAGLNERLKMSRWWSIVPQEVHSTSDLTFLKFFIHLFIISSNIHEFTWPIAQVSRELYLYSCLFDHWSSYPLPGYKNSIKNGDGIFSIIAGVLIFITYL